MKQFLTQNLLLCLFFFPLSLWAQPIPITAVNDTLCLQSGDPITANVTDNDIFPPNFTPFIFQLGPQDPCFGIKSNGDIYLLPGAGSDCCGEHLLRYIIENCQGAAQGNCIAEVYLTYKCPKPDCFLVNLADFTGNGSAAGGAPDEHCVSACEHSTATYYVPYNPTSTYSWNVSGGTFTPGANPAEISVVWGATGSGSIALSVTDVNNVTKIINVCVDILPAPVANFLPQNACVCLNAPISFDNLSIGGSSYYWDFGDGNSSTMFEPTHQYGGPGTYTVVLYVTNANFGPNGEALCCCTDTMALDVMVDSLPGPNIYWISTLCAGDSSKYWTDATNCSNYNWTVLNELGLPIPFTGQGNDTICVHWGNGPFGTISLSATGCNTPYCSKPSTVTVPIISPNAPISGPMKVCENESAVYSLPKWMSVVYDWTVTGGTILSGDSTHTIVVQWGAAGTGSITVNYSSPFLSGLPGHGPGDCEGTASLSVVIKPKFSVVGPSPALVCLNSSSTFSATSTPWASYNWTVSPAAPFTGQGSNSINVSWNAPGTYIVSAMPTDTTKYCNKKVSKAIQVIEVPKPDSISGPVEICPGDSYTYFGHSGETGVGFLWNITGGTPATATGNPVTIQWNATGPYSICLSQYQINAPYCASDTIKLNLIPKLIVGPLVITGPPACINSVKPYVGGPAQHPEALWCWSVVPANAGSIVGGQGTANVQVQWNNTPGPASLKLLIKLCNAKDSILYPVTLISPVVPNITQTGVLCPGSSATLNAGGGFTNYIWSTGSTTQTTSISTGGTYLVTTTDGNGCTALDTYQAVALAGPTVSISTGDNTTLCINPPNNNMVTLVANATVGVNFEWFCNGVSQGPPSLVGTLKHTNTNVVGMFVYYVKVTDANGCTAISNSIKVTQKICTGGNGPICVPQAYTLSFTAVNQTPNCNIVNFTASFSNAILVGWNFGDVFSNVNSGTLPNAVHTYTQAGCVKVELFALVPSQNGNDTCLVSFSSQVCIPIAAKFTCTTNCSTVTFTNASSAINTDPITSYMWDFGDFMTSTGINPIHNYNAPGTYTVTLMAFNASGCKATYSKTVVVNGFGPLTLSATPTPACAGVPIQFSGPGAPAIIWLWNFNDGGATNASQNPSHTYLSPGTYNVTLNVQDAQGCPGSGSLNLVVFPAPPQDTIKYTPGLTVCAGTIVTLTAPSGTGYSYLWSTNATTQVISTGTAGTYSVTVQDANGCTMIPDPVTVVILPLPPAYISGPSYICDSGCITLSAPAGQGYTYQWLNSSNVPLSPPEINQTLQVCDNNLQPGYIVVVTDANGCSNSSAPFAVALAVSPMFSISVSPDSCEGTPATLSIVSPQTNVIYSWSNGATGTSTIVIQAGVYTAVGTDTITGCRGSATATIHPLPDLCIVPVGCYKVCNPDTICGPAGLAGYQWNLNGTPIPGATGQCLAVTQSGAYSLTGTTAYGCELTSDSLILMAIPCGCSELMVTAEPTEADSCCWTLSYNNPIDSLFALVIHTDDADLNANLSGLNPSLSVFSISANSIALVNSTANSPIPSGMLNDFITICLSNTVDSPQVVIIDWYDFDFGVFCSDTLEFNCPVEPDCLYLQSDSIYCHGSEVQYTITICNPHDAPWPVAYFIVQPSAPTGIVVTPPSVDLTTNPILPGQCRTFTFSLSGPNLEGFDFCYKLIAHNGNPEKDTTLCCSLDSMYCNPIPDCLPCDDVSVKEVAEVTATGSPAGSCCYKITLTNNYAAGYFNGINLCMISPNTSMTLNNNFGSGWFTSFYSPTLIELDAMPPMGTSLPLGPITLPTICIKTTEAPDQLLEIKWMQGDSVVCRDTVKLHCEPPCGYVKEEHIVCDPATGGWVYSGTIKNTSLFTMGEAHVSFNSPAGMNVYNATIPLGALPPGGTFPFNIPLGAPAVAGDTVCFTVSLHVVDDDNQHLQCCNFYDCIVLPDCILAASCNCDEAFYNFKQDGIQVISSNIESLTGVFQPNSPLNAACDQVLWHFSDNQEIQKTTGAEKVEHVFPKEGKYSVCIYILRTDVNGNLCETETCSTIEMVKFKQLSDILISPNPTPRRLAIKRLPPLKVVNISLLDLQGRQLGQYNERIPESGALELDLADLAAGVYILQLEYDGERKMLKVVKQ